VPLSIRSGEPAFDALPAACDEWFAAEKTATETGVDSLERTADALYFRDIRPALEPFFDAPLPDGSFYSARNPIPDSAPQHTIFFDDLVRGVRFERDALQPDTESRAILAFHRAWQSTGDADWLKAHLRAAQRALETAFTHPHRWSNDLELPRRAFTLDAWPVSFGGRAEFDRTLQNVPWCVFPGDAGLLFRACHALAGMSETAGEEAEIWRVRASHLEAQLNSVGWNGAFYSHQIHLVPARVRGVDETRQLAACNARLMNSGVASREQCVAILKEIARRAELFTPGGCTSGGCAWWSIQPPFPLDIFGVAPGEGPNGGLNVETGGEVALAALANGNENIGIETLRRFHEIAVVPRRVFGFYSDDRSPQREWGEGTRGAAAMLRALIQGVCGIEDRDCLFGDIVLSPRWPAARVASADVEVSYAASGAYVSYRWNLDGGRLTLDWDSKARRTQFRLLLPQGNLPERVALNGRTQPYILASIEKSKYVELETDKKRGTLAVTLK
jgi:hypothetical protein